MSFIRVGLVVLEKAKRIRKPGGKEVLGHALDKDCDYEDRIL